MANAARDGGFSRTACLPPRRRLLATATVTFGMTAALLGSCSSGKQASNLDNATNTLRERLAATEKPLGQQAQPAFQAVADAMAAARNAGMSSQAMLGEVLASKVRLWNRPAGMDTYLANNQALTGKTVMVPAPVRGSSAPGGKNAADRPAAGPPNPPQPKTFFVNGVLNNGGADLAHAAATVGGAANTKVTGVYNFSFTDLIYNVELGQQSATSPGVLENKPDDLKTLINSLAGPYSLPSSSRSGRAPTRQERTLPTPLSRPLSPTR